jgi:DNA-binding winged helix-turn-helix (wHTH) protein
LVYLVQNRDHVVGKDDLIKGVWSGRIVSDSTLSSRITAVRKAIGDSGDEQRLIRTVPRKGVRFVGVVQEEPRSVPSDKAEASTTANTMVESTAMPGSLRNHGSLARARSHFAGQQCQALGSVSPTRRSREV